MLVFFNSQSDFLPHWSSDKMVVSNVYYLPNIVTFFAYSCTDYLVNIDKPDFIFLKTNTVCTNYSTNNSNTTTLLFCFAFSKFFLGDNGQTKTGERFSSKYSATFYYFCPTLFRAATAAKDAKDWSLPSFGSHLNPISTRGGRLCPPYTGVLGWLRFAVAAL